ncbi:MAG: hypothetical protein [Bacteriophage sp.]|nr:MAG: hypothetical protein [Bacteriophage sp.]
MIGLNIDASVYPQIIFSGVKYRKIPVADWLPPDFKDVIFVTSHNAPVTCYYSPASNRIIRSDNEVKVSVSDLKYWLRPSE